MTSRTFALSRQRRRRTRPQGRQEADASRAGAADDAALRDPYANAQEHAPDGSRSADSPPGGPPAHAAGARPDAPALPHERDEHADAPGSPRPPIAQAERDLAEGRVDTDLRRTAAEVFERALAPRRR